MKELTRKELDKLTPFELKHYSELGILRVMKTKTIPTRIEETTEFKKYKSLVGTPIHLREACRKYKIALSTMSRWVNRGLVKKLPEEGNKVMLDEAYVAYAVSVLRSHDKTQGQWLFETNGTPRINTTR
jgi:hypothetical protein